MTRRPGLIAGAPFLSDGGVRRILALLNDAGEEARVIGGAVRNTLMGLPVSDIDIATTALPETVLRRAASAGVHAVPTGIEHGTVTLVIAGVPHEVTTLREDIETDGRRAVVRFGRDFSHDALRRDFTINALGAEADGTVHDYAGGLADIAARRVRFIGDPDQRIAEDFLRILRLFRFSAAYGAGGIDPDGLAAARRGIAGLERLSRERVRQETLKLLVQPQAVAVLAVMHNEGFTAPVFGGPVALPRLERLAAIEAALGEKPDALRRLHAVAVATAQDVERLRERLKLSNAETERLARLASAPALPSPPQAGGGKGLPPPVALDAPPSSPPPARGGEGHGGGSDLAQKALLYRLGPDAYRDAVVARWLDAPPDEDTAYVDAYRLPQRWSAPKFPLTGADLIAAGWKPGPDLGAELARREQAWIAAGMPQAART